jgi:hypothetical protein
MNPEEIKKAESLIHDLVERLDKSQKENLLLKRIFSTFPFCPDHRDKIGGKPCRECEIERLETENADLKKTIMVRSLFPG